MELFIKCQMCKGSGENVQYRHYDDIEVLPCYECNETGKREYFSLSKISKDSHIEKLSKSELEEFRAKLISYYIKNG